MRGPTSKGTKERGGVKRKGEQKGWERGGKGRGREREGIRGHKICSPPE